MSCFRVLDPFGNTDMVFCDRKEPRSAGHPPFRHPRHPELSPSHPFPAPGPRYSDPGPSVSPQYRSRMDYSRNHSVTSTASTVSSASSSNSSFFGKSYSLSSGMENTCIRVADLTLASSVADDGYVSPPSSRRTSETTKLPSIHELEKNLPQTIELHSTSSSPTKRASLATITEEIPPPAPPPPPPPARSFPPEFPGTTIAAIPKARANSYPSPSNHSFPPHPPQSFADRHALHPLPRESHSKHIADAIQFRDYMVRVVRSFEMVLITFLAICLIVDSRGISTYIRFRSTVQGLARPGYICR